MYETKKKDTIVTIFHNLYANQKKKDCTTFFSFFQKEPRKNRRIKKRKFTLQILSIIHETKKDIAMTIFQ